MSTEETVVMNFLGEAPETWFSRREVARKAVRREEFDEHPHWAAAAISGLLSRGKIEENSAGNIKFKQREF